jgi:hypothetical protein
MQLQKRTCKNSYSLPLTEFRGEGSPHKGLLPSACRGDIYLDVKFHTVWYLSDSWVEWAGMSQQHTHPTDIRRFLNPTPAMFAWSNKSTFANALLQSERAFGCSFGARDIITRYLSQSCDLSPVGETTLPQQPLTLDTDSNMLGSDSPKTDNNDCHLLMSLTSKGPDLTTGLAGTQFPVDAKPISWINHGLETYGPFIRSDLGDLVSCKPWKNQLWNILNPIIL